jgi:hypothetical protein
VHGGNQVIGDSVSALGSASAIVWRPQCVRNRKMPVIVDQVSEISIEFQPAEFGNYPV